MVYPLLGLINHKEKNKELLVILKLLQCKQKKKKALLGKKFTHAQFPFLRFL